MIDTSQWKIPKDWARTFFDEGFEETFRRLGKFESTETDAADIIHLLNLGRESQVLDIPCGFGRFSDALSRHGISVIGVDSSTRLLAQARQRYSTPTFLEGDMRTPPNGPFDAVLNLWTSFGYFDSEQEDLSALQAWFRILKPAGQLLMELTDLERAEFENRNSHEKESLKFTQFNGVTEHARFVWDENRAYIRYTRDSWSRCCSMRIYSQQELREMLNEVGFMDVTFFGNFRSGQKQSKDRLVVVAKKK